MASTKILNAKKEVVSEITENIKNSQSVILFQYQGLTVSELGELRKELRNCDAKFKIYKNTLLKIALDDLNYSFDGFLGGPNALLFGNELLAPIKVISDFAKKYDKLEVRIGVISGSVADLKTITEYANIPSYEGLLTMLAGGLMEHVKHFAIGLNLIAEQKEQ